MKRPESSVVLRALRDALVILAVPVALILIHYITPEATREQLRFVIEDPNLIQAWTSGYIHNSWGHLSRNLQSYAVVVPVVYAVYWRWRHREGFRAVFFIVLAVTPLVTSLLDFTVRHVVYGATGTTAGFSGVTNAYAGVLLVVIALFVSQRLTRTIGVSIAVIAYFLAAWLILDNLGSATFVTEALIVLVMILLVSFSMITLPDDAFNNVEVRWNHVIDAVIVVVAVFVFMVGGASGFPANAAEDGVNVLAHFTGLLFGILVAVVEWWRREKPRISLKPFYTKRA